MTISIEQLGKLMLAKRGSRGVRAAAAEVDISSATFSRVENGHMPDLETFAKICKWIDRAPGEFLGFEASGDASAPGGAQVHLRKKPTVSRETAESLGALILKAQAAAQVRNRLLG
ncbi:MAG: transcriptional regulator [Alphaproteobacteria bacterium]|nr:MAG: transcriptional regulator [Alphaproteobacteria bacterium]